jgi:AcrR family transcriptional regulator
MSRPYRSTRRTAQAEATRRLIVDAAARVFAERGYAGATLAAIAEAADVALPTVYASIGGKPALLSAIHERIDQASDVPAALERMAAETDPVELVRMAIATTRRINEGFGDLIAVLRAAASSEPDAAAALGAGLKNHRIGFDFVARRLDELGALRDGLSPQAASEALGVLTLWSTWESMVHHYAWSWDAAADWLLDVARATILRPTRPKGVIAGA